MSLLLSVLWPGLAAALVLGLLTGVLAGVPARPAVPLALCALAALAALLAFAGAVPGIPGLWLESAGLILPAYLGGCGLGALSRSRARPAAGTPPGHDSAAPPSRSDRG